MLLFAGLATAAGCATDMSEDEATLINEYIQHIDPFDLPEPGTSYGPTSEAEQDGDFSCSTQSVAETRQYDQLVAFSANSEALWPGAIVSGTSLENGQLAPISLARAPLSFSVSLGNLSGNRAATLDDPRLSTYRDALSDLLSVELQGSTTANLYSKIEEVHSAEQLALSLGLRASALSGLAGSVSAGFDFRSESVHSRFLVKYTQAYYTVDVDPPGMPSDYLDPGVTLEDVEDQIAPNDPPLYVSSITYGRTILFTFESEYTYSEMAAALAFTYQQSPTSVSGELEAEYKSMLEQSRINAYIVGGNGGEAAQSIDSYTALMDLIKNGGEYSLESPGAPIAYKLAYLSSNQPARVALTEDYSIKECVRVSQRVRVVFDSFELENTGDSDDNLEVYGDVWASFGDEQILFSRDAAGAVTVAEGERWPSTGSVSEVILDVVPEDGQTIEVGASLYDHDKSWLNGDDDLGTEVYAAPFESGWRRDLSVLITGEESTLRVNFRLEPL